MIISVPVFTGYITGSQSSLPDYPFRLKQFSRSLNNGVNSYYSLTAPFDNDLLVALSERGVPDIHILADGQPFDYFNLESVQYFKGANSSAITLSGYRQWTNATPVAHTVTDSMIIDRRIDSSDRLVLTVIPFVLPAKVGDTLHYGAADYTLASIQTNTSQLGPAETYTMEEVP